MIGRRSSPSTLEADKPKGFDDFELKLGDMMRGERATLSKSLLDVQRELRIKAAYIAAIEAGDIAAFDTPSFISGYVRSYARYLGMDPDWTFARFCEESGFQPTHGMAPAASGPKPQRRPTDVAEALANPSTPFVPKPESFWSKIELRAVGSLLVLAVLGGGIGYGGWTVLQEVQRVHLSPVDQSPGMTVDIDPLDGAAGQDRVAEADVSPAAPTSEALDRIYRPQTLETPVLIARDGPIAAIDPNRTGLLVGTGTPVGAQGVAQGPAGTGAGLQQVAGAQQLPGPQPLPGQLVAAGLDPAAIGPMADAAGGALVRTTGADAPEVEVLAVRPAWVRIKAADGSVLLEKVMDAGERFALPKLEEPPVMRIGESGAIYFAVNGVAHGPAGKRGEVTKNIVLSSQALDEKFAVANVSADGDLAKMVAVADAGAVLPAPAPAQ